jgi:WD40 repeat protein
VIHTARGCKVWNLKGNESGPGDPIELGYHPFAFALDGRSILSVEKEDPGYLWIYRLGTPDEPPDYRWFYCKDQFAQLFLSRATHKPWIVSPSLAFVAGFCGAEILLWYLDGSTYCLPGAEDDEEDIYQDICDDPTATRQGTLVGHSAAITNLLFSPDEQLLASASADGTVRLWETATGICRQQLRGQKAEIGQIAFSASGDSLTAIDAKGVTYVWSIPDGHELSRLVPPDGHRPLPALSHDGRIAATYTDEPPRVYIWSIPEQRNIAQMPGTLAGISPNGRMAALYRSPVREAELPFATDDEDADSAYTIWRIPESVHGPEA